MEHVYSLSKVVFTTMLLIGAANLNAQNPTTVAPSNACNVVEDFNDDDGGFSSQSIFSNADDASFYYVGTQDSWIESSGLAIRDASIISGVYSNAQPSGGVVVGFKYNVPVGTQYRIRIINAACNCVGGPEVIATTANGPMWTALPSTNGTLCVKLNDADLVQGQNIRYEISFRANTFGNLVFDDFSLGETAASPLPVKFKGVTARKENSTVKILWDVAEEQNVKGYQVERSSNGVNYTTVGFVDANGKPNYGYTDASAQVGTNYYRIKSLDIDGQFKYSGIIKVSVNGASSIKLFPMPAQTFVNVQHRKISNGRISLTTADGRVLQNVTPDNGSFQTRINLNGIPSGLYIVRVENENGEVESVKLVKQ